jgi:hypothetical protein
MAGEIGVVSAHFLDEPLGSSRRMNVARAAPSGWSDNERKAMIASPWALVKHQ